MISAIALAVAASSQAHAASPVDVAAIRAAMKEASFIVGEWEGEGWMFMEGGRQPSKVSEKATLQAGGTVLAFAGLGTTPDGKVVHDAYGVLSYDPVAKEYNLRSHLADGNVGNFKATVSNGTIVWNLPTARPVRFTIKLDDQGRWHEVGEVKMPDEKWMMVMEMTLTKKK